MESFGAACHWAGLSSHERTRYAANCIKRMLAEKQIYSPPGPEWVPTIILKEGGLWILLATKVGTTPPHRAISVGIEIPIDRPPTEYSVQQLVNEAFLLLQETASS